ncbi:hypothetical protein BGZ96_006877 [Linnemannia gamsii]|uniref:Uncharacterized protein n=1 Tax=Linnemannia gamsii TaxID=64522 RepID=A0ABQ7K339_9FUNG|nr:hypothetical protein BGZ96_006877 [Linnemannia gamsii]
MSQIRLRQMRKWMVFIATLNLLGMLIYYGYLGYYIENQKRYSYYNSSPLLWGDWVTIITAIGYFIFYIFALRGVGFQNIHKYLRAFLLLIPTIAMLYLTCKIINITLLNYNGDHSYGSGYDSDFPGPFDCLSIENYGCYMSYTNLFMSLITALFVVIEIGMTLAWGPLEKAHQFGTQGYIQNANVILVSPDQPYQQQQQQFYYPQQPQQQFQYQQGFHPQMQQLQHPPQQPILGSPDVAQHQGPDSPMAHLPYTPSVQTQSPVAATATSGYQPSPQPSSSPYTPTQ